MIYENIKQGKFIERPNRFVALAEIDGQTEVCHVKNTGRCRELLTPGARVIVQRSDKPERKTKYDIVAVFKGDVLFNIDSQAPNRVFGEWLKKTDFFGEVTLIKPERKFLSSRFDFYVEAGDRRIFVEVKGVTLERDGVFLFPDAPTERGARHLRELAECVKLGYDACAVFVVQAEGARYFVPNEETDPAFSEALRQAKNAGVEILCLCCRVSESSLEISDFVEVRL